MSTLDYIKEREQNKGLQKGLRKGLQQGRQQGRQEGRQDRNKKIALNMLKERADTSFISKVTGLSLKEIKQLKNSS